MELLLILIYVSICYAVFKIFGYRSTNGLSRPRLWAASSVLPCCC